MDRFQIPDNREFTKKQLTDFINKYLKHENIENDVNDESFIGNQIIDNQKYDNKFHYHCLNKPIDLFGLHFPISFL
ncbi:hypothetical protein TRFO_12802 [Tritrichomonas foetus]|uniref:Uncharacterized protein n=1 Tax=Tritrichomonas foetus TaxID=1144522 RepID=A0A1J4L4M3_9EUKA|nr:hypothetical protein TRFO_12802 [Tritrichomonas foetus]|eukprot:OHT16924.1 hypothetical protein TRFO_12802 [Tritrichomonas foetus]